MILLNPAEISFPDPAQYDPEQGLIALGGDLTPERLLFAYETGIFPWYNPGEPILWWCPDPRFVLYPEKIKVSKSMRKVLRDGQFTFTENTRFREVMEACQQVDRKEQDGTWISGELIDSFETLHRHGLAKSIEVWKDGALAGGFYGLQIGRVFCGESMFSRVSNASKAGFIHFVQTHAAEIDLVDCQIYSAHLESLGAEMIPKRTYLDILKQQIT